MEKEKKGGRKKKKRMASLDSLMLTSAKTIFLMVRAAGQIKTGRDRWLICIQRRD